MKKLSLKHIKDNFEQESCQFLTKRYIDSKQKLDYICSNGHKHSITWNSWESGHRCPYCSGNDKKTIEFIEAEFKKEGYQLLITEYINNKQKLRFICPKGHRHSINWNDWRGGKRCPYCAGNAKLTIEFIRIEFEKEGYELLTGKYKNVKQKLCYICPNGHKHNISWHEWGVGNRCPYCAGNARLDIEFIRSKFAKENYKLLTVEYINCKQKLDYICPNGHKHSTSWDKWHHGVKCPTCAIINRSGKDHYNWQGGISCEPYCDAWADKDFKESIKERDNYICQNPDCWGSSKKLTVHHIDYVKKNCSPTNLITLCNSCNSRANVDREWHTSWYQIIMNKKYGYCYEQSSGSSL